MLGMTEAAVTHAKALATELGREPVVRVRVVAGGCSGLTWDIALGRTFTRSGDVRRETNGVTVVVDAASAPYLRDAVLDVGTLGTNVRRTRDEPAGRVVGLVVRKHGGADVCSCGESFAP